VRYNEAWSRKEFVKAQKEIERIELEEAKIMRKNEALEEKLKLTVDQLNIIEEEQEAVVGDRMAELKAWKMDIDSEIQFDKKVAAGAFGIVYLGTLRSTGRKCAVKQLLSDQVNQENMSRFFQEILLHSSLHHPHLVDMIAASWEPPNLCLVLAYCEGGDLNDLLEERFDVLKWQSHKLRMMREIAQAMAYLHQRHPPVIHRDLKTANVLVDIGMKMKVSDFGESREYNPKAENMTMVGTNFYIAPEVFRGDSHYDMKADVFGVGMIMLAMAVKKGSLRNFFVDNLGFKVKINANFASTKVNEGYRPELLNHNGKLSGKLDLSDDDKLREPLAKFISTLISPDPTERPTMNEVVKSMDNLERWICIRPPTWASELDSSIVLGGIVCHPERGRGSIVSFDGFERVHVLYEEGTDLYRRYNEEGWLAKMSVGEVVTNERVVAAQTAALQPQKRRSSISIKRNVSLRMSGGSNKVGVDNNNNNNNNNSRDNTPAYAYGSDPKNSMGLISYAADEETQPQQHQPKSEQMEKIVEMAGANGDIGALEMSPVAPSNNRLATIKSFDASDPSVDSSAGEDKKTSTLSNSAVIRGESLGPRDIRGSSGIMGLSKTAGTVAAGSVGAGMGSSVAAVPGGRAKRRRSSLMALAADATFDPSSAVMNSLQKGHKTASDPKAEMNSMQEDMKRAVESMNKR
jgi:serine/threonine protein kinase